MAKMRISPELKKLIEKYRCVKDTEGMSPAKVYKLVGENENLYLKMTDSRYKGTTYDVEREKDMMLWLEGKLPVPKVLHFERHDGWSNLLMSEADGVLCSEEYEDEQSPEKIIELYAECIRLFHSIDISDCPYTNSLDRHYPYIVSGNDHVDYEKAFQILHEQYGCKYMRTDSGGGLTNKLLENGLIDEISLVISPCFVGNKEKQLFDNLLLSEKVNLELQGTENAEHGCLSLRYAVKNKD